MSQESTAEWESWKYGAFSVYHGWEDYFILKYNINRTNIDGLILFTFSTLLFRFFYSELYQLSPFTFIIEKSQSKYIWSLSLPSASTELVFFNDLNTLKNNKKLKSDLNPLTQIRILMSGHLLHYHALKISHSQRVLSRPKRSLSISNFAHLLVVQLS